MKSNRATRARRGSGAHDASPTARVRGAEEPRRRARQALGLGGLVMLVATTACASAHSLHGPEPLPHVSLDRLSKVQAFHFAFETTERSCQLERAAGGEQPEGDWQPVDANSLTRNSFTVLDARYLGSGDDVHTVMLRVEDGIAGSYWLRNVRASSSAQSALRWRCATDDRWTADRLPKGSAKVVRLSLDSTSCPGIVPILGGREDVSFSPYTVVGYGLFAGTPPDKAQVERGETGLVVVGVKLEAEGGDKRLTVPAAVFDRCFVAADRVPPKPSEAAALLEWLASTSPDASTPPPVSSETAEGVTGIDPSSCAEGPIGAHSHLECRRPVLRVIADPSPGPFGPSVIQLVQERIVDAFHFVDDALVSPHRAVSVTAAVRTPGLDSASAFHKAFYDALRQSVDDEKRRLERGTRGFQIRSGLEPPGADDLPSTHYVDVEVSYSVPEVEASTERRVHKYVAGKKTVDNPAHAKAEQELASAKAAVVNAEQEAQLAEAAADAAATAAGTACDAIGGIGGLLCDAGTSAASSATGLAIQQRVAAAKERLAKAKAALASTPLQVEVDDVREHAYEAKILRRRGEAKAKLAVFSARDDDEAASAPRVTSATSPSRAAGPAASPRAASGPGSGAADRRGVVPGSKQPLFATTIQVPFDASDVEIPDDPEHKLVGKQAKPPTADDVEQALARALVGRVDEAVIRWGEQRLIGGDIGDLAPGTRAWMVAVARHATADRPIELLSDILEQRSEAWASGSVSYPVRMPKELDGRCFVFAAIPMDGKLNVNLELGLLPGGQMARFLPVARDVRSSSEAAFEVCGVRAGDYAVRVEVGEGGAPGKGVLVSMFDSTPGRATHEHTLAAARGLPTTARRGETLRLDGEGVVTYKGTARQLVVGRQGDRDGDGILDDDDRCPYDPETVNGHLDADGCPDEAPK